MSCPLFIAEVSSNHHQDLERCYDFIDTAAVSGCQAVKFQLFKIDQLFSPEILEKSERHRLRKQWELDESFIPLLAEQCRLKNIQFSCTPFYLDAVNILKPHVDFFKIASYELLWDELIARCAKTKRPLILSTGMANLDEIDHAVGVARDAGCKDLTLLHCVSAYPTPVDQCNLRSIDTLRTRYQCKVGWSDHSVSPAVIYRATQRWQAETVEFHLDLDGTGEEYAAGHCWLPAEISEVISLVSQASSADGSGEKIAVNAEEVDRLWRADPSDGLRPFVQLRGSFDG